MIFMMIHDNYTQICDMSVFQVNCHFYGACLQLQTTLHIFYTIDLKSRIQEENILVNSHSGHLLPSDIKEAFIQN